MIPLSEIRQKWLALLFILLAYLGLLYVVDNQVKSSVVSSVEKTGLQQLSLFTTFLEGQLEKFEFLPELLSTNIRIKEFLRRPQEKVRTESVNRYLETINRIAGSADTYLMDSRGETLAASNWLSDKSFVGKYFDYRPYFKDAMEGRRGRYFALGTTSEKRGYYFSYPVRDGVKIIGAVVMKIDIDNIESSWEQGDDELIISDPDGVIFISSEKKWLYHTTVPLSTEKQREIRESNRYRQASLALWPGDEIDPASQQSAQSRVLGTGKQAGAAGRFLMHSQFMEKAGWQVHILSSLRELQPQRYLAGFLTTIVFVALMLLGLFLQQRRRRLQDKTRYEEESRRALHEAHDFLEHRVQERTVDLQHEVEVRRQAEEELRQAQSELIQTAKLAVLGQMSTGISHELNQPLAAIRSYADNARLLLDKDRTAEARGNLERISTLVDRMAQISAQLKQFSRKTSGQCVKVSLSEAMDASLRILGPKLKRSSMTVDNRLAGVAYRVHADPVQLEQILINLISNAVNACVAVTEPSIIVTAEPWQGLLRVSVRDNGHGIKAENAEEIFEPFFTTRESGLGLGLSISRRIARSMEGELGARNHPAGGAEFMLDLKIVD